MQPIHLLLLGIALVSTREGEAAAPGAVATPAAIYVAPVAQAEQRSPAVFGLAVREVLPRHRFPPARVGAGAVRQLVERRFAFRLD